MNASQEVIRAEQLTLGRKQAATEGDAITTLSKGQETRRHAPINRSPHKESLRGHEAFLKGLEQSEATVQFEKAGSGEIVIGKVKCSDKFTISVKTAESTRVLFKHDISEFSTPNVVRPTGEPQ